MNYGLLIPLTAFTLMTAPAAAVSKGDLLEAIRACGSIKTDAERLTCFDAISASEIARSSTNAEATAAQKPTLEERKDAFGAQAIMARKKSHARAKGDGGTELNEVTYKLLEAGTNRSGKMFFIMENGQVWRQLPADTGKVRIPRKLDNLEVTIKRKMLGSHILIIKGRSIKVKRLK